MALVACLDCTAQRAPDVPLCPHCGSERADRAGAGPRVEGDTMPKISKHGGASYAGEPQEGGEGSSPGSSSSTSQPKPASGPKSSGPGHRKRARTTGSRSKQHQAADSDAPSTGGGGRKTPSSDD